LSQKKPLARGLWEAMTLLVPAMGLQGESEILFFKHARPQIKAGQIRMSLAPRKSCFRAFEAALENFPGHAC
jgi:hypothetical protein